MTGYEMLQWAVFAIVLLAVASVGTVICDAVKHRLHLRRVARAARFAASDGGVEKGRNAAPAPHVGVEAGVASAQSVRADQQRIGAGVSDGGHDPGSDVSACVDRCARCWRVALLQRSLLCPVCERTMQMNREGAKEGDGRG